jgi:hypothetical protein
MSSVEDNEPIRYLPPNEMTVDRGFVTSHGPVGLKYKAQDKVEEVYDPKVRKANRDLRRATIAEKEMWNRKLLCMWKTEIEEKNHLLVVPRAAFTLRKKLKYGLKNCLDKIA